MNKIDWKHVGNYAGFVVMSTCVGFLAVIAVIPSTLLSGAYMGMLKFHSAVNRKEEDIGYDAYLHPLDLIMSAVLLFKPSNVKARMAALFAKSDPSDIAPIDGMGKTKPNVSMGGEDNDLHSVDKTQASDAVAEEGASEGGTSKDAAQG